MKVLRTVSIVVVIIGIFVWFFVPLISAATFQSSDGIPAASLIFYGNSEYSVWQDTALYWVSLASVILLGLCLLCIFLKSFRGACLCSLIAIVVIIVGGNQARADLDTVISFLLGVDLSVGLPLLLGVFGILFGLSILSFCKVKNVLSAISIVFAIFGAVVWFAAPFLSYDIFRGADAYSSASLVFSYGLEHFPLAHEAWQSTSLYWMPLVGLIFLAACLLLACLKELRWMGISALAGVVTLIVGGVTAPLLGTVGMHLGIGFYLLIGLFATFVCFSVLDFIHKQEDTANSRTHRKGEYL